MTANNKKIDLPAFGQVTEDDPTVRASTTMRRSTRIELAAYQAFYAAGVKQDLPLAKLIEEGLKAFMKNDKAFVAFKQNYPELVEKARNEVMAEKVAPASEDAAA